MTTSHSEILSLHIPHLEVGVRAQEQPWWSGEGKGTCSGSQQWQLLGQPPRALPTLASTAQYVRNAVACLLNAVTGKSGEVTRPEVFVGTAGVERWQGRTQKSAWGQQVQRALSLLFSTGTEVQHWVISKPTATGRLTHIAQTTIVTMFGPSFVLDLDQEVLQRKEPWSSGLFWFWSMPLDPIPQSDNLYYMHIFAL